MRWSLVLSTFVALQATLSVALVIPSSTWEELERRGPEDIKASSSTYRQASTEHPYKLDQSPGGTITGKTKLTPQEIDANAKKGPVAGTHADHLLEKQQADRVLKDNGLTFGGLPSPLKKDLKETFNGPRNVMPVDPSTNIQKGQATRAGLKGDPAKDDRTRRDSYIQQVHSTAKKVGGDMDASVEKHLGPNALPQGGFKAIVSSTAESSGTLKRGPSPATSESSKSNKSGNSNSPPSSPTPSGPPPPKKKKTG